MLVSNHFTIRAVCGVVWVLRGLAPGRLSGAFAGRLGDCLGGVWPRLIGPVCRLFRLFRFALGPGKYGGAFAPVVGADWRGDWGGLVGPRLIGAGLAPGRLGGEGRSGNDLK